ncbi:MAG: hypothetical protein LBE95_00335, partial [Holosporaceae bacterium]|nr:hypothetical protein [Holosporaceae bacterium]
YLARLVRKTSRYSKLKKMLRLAIKLFLHEKFNLYYLDNPSDGRLLDKYRNYCSNVLTWKMLNASSYNNRHTHLKRIAYSHRRKL